MRFIMDEDILAHGGVNVAREETGSPTQPFSSPGRPTFSKDIHSDIDTTSYNYGDVGGIEGGDDESTVSDESENNEDGDTDDIIHNTSNTNDATLIDCTYAIHSVTWDDADGQTKEVYNPKSEFKLDIYTNTSANKAMFTLHSYINLKTSRRRSNKQNVYLLIPPERIKAITTQTSPAARATASNTAIPQFYSLHFSLIQQPDFIGPQRDLPPSKGKTKAQLDLLQDLAIVTEFTIHLASSDTVTPKQQKDLELLATIFSPVNTENHPRSDNKRGNPATLYAGKGGKVISINKGVARDEASPPPYHSDTLDHPPVSKKRRRPDADDDYPSVPRISPFAQYFDALACQINTRFDNLECSIKERNNRVENLERSIQEFNTRFDNLERSIKDVKDAIEDRYTDRTPCRWDTEERDGFVEVLTDLCDDHDTTFDMKSQDLIEEFVEELEKERDKMREECEEITNKYRDEVQEAQEDIHATEMRLKNARVRFDGPLILDF
ncbi:hypothetical protein J3F84DRAFT_376161 [Trichoderma pleuroticola]